MPTGDALLLNVFLAVCGMLLFEALLQYRVTYLPIGSPNP